MGTWKTVGRLLFGLGGAWLVLDPVLHTAVGNPVAWIAPFFGAAVLVYVGEALVALIPD